MVDKVKVRRQPVVIDYPTEEEFFSKEAKQINKYQVFKNWLHANGVIGLDRASYPHRFDALFDQQGTVVPNSGYLGTVAIKEIKHREIVLAVPLNMCISVDQIKYGFSRPHSGKPDNSFKPTELGLLMD